MPVFRDSNRLSISNVFTVCLLFLALFSATDRFIVRSTADLAVNTIQVVTGSRCRIGTVYRPSSCTRCVCGLFNFMLCRQTCVPSQDEQLTTSRPSGPRPTGPTVVPILIPSIIRNPIRFLFNSSREIS